MFYLLYISDDILIYILNLYINNCCKLHIDLNKIIICKNIYILYKNNILNFNKCNILHIKKINYKICSYHNNISFDFIKKLLKEINRINRINISNNLNFIHIDNIKKYESIVNNILYKYNYTISGYCCGGNGCKLIKLK